MLLRGSIAALAFAVSALTGAPTARADEAYVCEAGRVVYVRPGELEAMKHSDACIASYYGIVLSPPTVIPSASATSAAPASAPPVDFKTLDAPENQANNARSPAIRLAQAGPAAVHHRAPAIAALGTDFRNVRLINGGPDGDGWYRHTQ